MPTISQLKEAIAGAEQSEKPQMDLASPIGGGRFPAAGATKI